MKNYLPSFSVDEAKKLYLLLNKNSKCLLYKFNDWIELLGAEKNLIRHSSEAEDAVGLKREENDRQFLIEKIIYVEKENLYAVEMAKKQQILCSRLKKNYRIVVLVCGHSRHVYPIYQHLRFG